ncbi:hypothetical protein FRC18_000530 [Serendipita sp. 400]|nr:hypothetical protein FRC18_000530 [Serendipita sp. 400]
MTNVEPGHALTLYIWPHSWNLPSFDVDSLACVLYLQIYFSNDYELVESTDPDLSSACVLPFLRHGNEEIVTTRGIVKYLENLRKRSNDQEREKLNRAKMTAWESYANIHLKDVVNSVLYADPDNYREGIHAILSTKLPIPTRYYLSRRLREQVRESLEPAGLWTSRADEDDDAPKRPFDKVKTIVDDKVKIFDEAFTKEKLLDKAREIFDVLNPLLGHASFFFESKEPSSLDCQIASCVLILENAKLPKNPLHTLLHDSYPHILEHAQRTMSLAFPQLSSDQQGNSAPKVSTLPHANVVVQIGRAMRRVAQSIL